MAPASPDPFTALSPLLPVSPFIHSRASSVPIHHSSSRRPPALLPASPVWPSDLHAGPAPPELRLVPWPPLILPLLSACGDGFQPPRAQSPLRRSAAWPHLARPAAGPTVCPLASSPRSPLHLQLRLPKPRLCSGDPHLPPSPALIGRCLTTDPHNKTSDSEPRPPRLPHQSVSASAPPAARLDQSKQALLPLSLSTFPLFPNWANHEEGELESRPSASKEPMRTVFPWARLRLKLSLSSTLPSLPRT